MSSAAILFGALSVNAITPGKLFGPLELDEFIFQLRGVWFILLSFSFYFICLMQIV